MLGEQAALRKDRTTRARLEHRHFAEIARIISLAPEWDRQVMAQHFADHLRGTNANFDRARFMRACQP